MQRCAHPQCWYAVPAERFAGSFCCKRCAEASESRSKPEHGWRCEQKEYKENRDSRWTTYPDKSYDYAQDYHYKGYGNGWAQWSSTPATSAAPATKAPTGLPAKATPPTPAKPAATAPPAAVPAQAARPDRPDKFVPAPKVKAPEPTQPPPPKAAAKEEATVPAAPDHRQPPPPKEATVEKPTQPPPAKAAPKGAAELHKAPLSEAASDTAPLPKKAPPLPPTAAASTDTRERSQQRCAHPQCTYAVPEDKWAGGFCCKRCAEAFETNSKPFHGRKCEQKECSSTHRACPEKPAGPPLNPKAAPVKAQVAVKVENPPAAAPSPLGPPPPPKLVATAVPKPPALPPAAPKPETAAVTKAEPKVAPPTLAGPTAANATQLSAAEPKKEKSPTAALSAKAPKTETRKAPPAAVTFAPAPLPKKAPPLPPPESEKTVPPALPQVKVEAPSRKGELSWGSWGGWGEVGGEWSAKFLQPLLESMGLGKELEGESVLYCCQRVAELCNKEVLELCHRLTGHHDQLMELFQTVCQQHIGDTDRHEVESTPSPILVKFLCLSLEIVAKNRGLLTSQDALLKTAMLTVVLKREAILSSAMLAVVNKTGGLPYDAAGTGSSTNPTLLQSMRRGRGSSGMKAEKQEQTVCHLERTEQTYQDAAQDEADPNQHNILALTTPSRPRHVVSVITVKSSHGRCWTLFAGDNMPLWWAPAETAENQVEWFLDRAPTGGWQAYTSSQGRCFWNARTHETFPCQ